jgi:hypothetical protein
VVQSISIEKHFCPPSVSRVFIFIYHTNTTTIKNTFIVKIYIIQVHSILKRVSKKEEVNPSIFMMMMMHDEGSVVIKKNKHSRKNTLGF